MSRARRLAGLDQLQAAREPQRPDLAELPRLPLRDWCTRRFAGRAFAPDTMRLLVLASLEADLHGDDVVHPEHLALTCVEQGDGLLAAALRLAGADLQALASLVRGHPLHDPAPPATSQLALETMVILTVGVRLSIGRDDDLLCERDLTRALLQAPGTRLTGLLRSCLPKAQHAYDLLLAGHLGRGPSART